MQTEMDDPVNDLTTVGADDFGDLEDTSHDDFGDDPSGANPAPAEEEEPKEEPKEGEAGEGDPKPEVEEEPEGEVEEEPEPEPEPESEPEPEPKQKDQQRIPKSRFDEVNERRKAAEKRAAELERLQRANDPSKAVDFDFKDAEKRYMDAVIDGKTDEALQIREEIRAAERTYYQAEVQQAQQQAAEMTKAELALNEVINAAQTDYPVFDGTSEQFNEDVTQEAMDLFESFKSRGYDPAAAMRRAVNYTVKANDLSPASAEQETASEPEPQQAEKPKAKRRTKTVDQKLADAEKQPPMPSQTRGGSEPDRDPMQMSEEEFDKLDPKEEARLRGDIL